MDNVAYEIEGISLDDNQNYQNCKGSVVQPADQVLSRDPDNDELSESSGIGSIPPEQFSNQESGIFDEVDLRRGDNTRDSFNSYDFNQETIPEEEGYSSRNFKAITSDVNVVERSDLPSGQENGNSAEVTIVSETNLTPNSSLRLKGKPLMRDRNQASDRDSKRKKRRSHIEVRFIDFATKYFQNGVSYSHETIMLEEPLLSVLETEDKIAALACWIVLLRYLGEVPDPPQIKDEHGNRIRNEVPLMGVIYGGIGWHFEPEDIDKIVHYGQEEVRLALQNPDDANAILISMPMRQNSVDELEFKGQIEMTRRRPSKAKSFMARLFERTRPSQMDAGLPDGTASDPSMTPYPPLFQDLHDDIDKVQFIVGHGILRPDIRDEIFCQICKQITDNRNPKSTDRAWTLLALCVSSFAASKKFLTCLRTFIKNGPRWVGDMCVDRLRRAITNGCRSQPPSWLELNALLNRQPMSIVVGMMDGCEITVPVDSSSNAYEICDFISNEIGLRDCFGFSMYITLGPRVCSLGSGADHVMDAISEFEQISIFEGFEYDEAPWRLFFRKEIFCPWHDVGEDQRSTDLIYHQVVRGMDFGEYQIQTEQSVLDIMTQRYYIDHGPIFSRELAEEMIPDQLPGEWKMKKSKKYWLQRMQTGLETSDYAALLIPPQKLMQGIVAFAIEEWPLLFSRFYEAVRYSGPTLPKNEVLVAVNWAGVYIMDETLNIFLALSYAEIVSVTCSRDERKDESSSRMSQPTFTINTVNDEGFCFHSPNSDDACDLILFFRNGLKSRSKYAIGVQDYTLSGSMTSVLRFQRGDLIVLLDKEEALDALPGEMSQEEKDMRAARDDWCYGECTRTGERGEFPAEMVFLMPTIFKPPDHILNVLHRYVLMEYNSGRRPGQAAGQTITVPDEKGIYPWLGDSSA